jgi:hypothetical protein
MAREIGARDVVAAAMIAVRKLCGGRDSRSETSCGRMFDRPGRSNDEDGGPAFLQWGMLRI